jgi:MGT family glycosyltransferase
MSGVTAVVFAMAERGHFKRMLPVIDGLCRAGATTYVFTDVSFREDVARAGGRFVDLFDGHTVAEADALSVPLPCRAVSFAGVFGDVIVNQVAALRPSLIVHDTFAVIGQVVAHHLGVPRVNVCAGHNFAPIPTLAALSRDPRVKIADACWAAVQILRERHGLPDASPFSYVSGISPELNLYCEPPQFLRPEDRAPFQPMAFFGSLWPEGERHAHVSDALFPDAPLRVYASFGTIIWRYYQEAALSALEAFSVALAGRTDAEAIIALGGAGPMDRASRFASKNVRVEHYVDQWRVLQEASIYCTHQGLNSTHEAIYHGVPMISYPFFSDQPALSARCQELGLAVPIVESLRGAVTSEDIRVALDRLAAVRPLMEERLTAAREWEMDTIRARPAVVRQMLDLVR